MTILYYDGDTKFDIAELTIKEPTYAVNGSINGLRNVGEENTSYEYTLSLPVAARPIIFGQPGIANWANGGIVELNPTGNNEGVQTPTPSN